MLAAMGKTAKTRSLVPVPLTAEQAALFDRLVRDERAAAKGRRHEKRARETRQQLAAIFGAAVLGATPDGRIVLRTPQSREYPPLEAKTVSWSEFQEVPAWDA